MCDFPLYAVNMFYSHWLIKTLLGPMAAQTRTRWEFQAEIEEKRRQSQEDAPLPLKETNAGRNFTDRPQPCGDKQINKTGLI